MRQLQAFAQKLKDLLDEIRNNYPDSIQEVVSIKGDIKDEWLLITVNNHWFHFVTEDKNKELCLHELYTEQDEIETPSLSKSEEPNIE